MTLSKPSAPWRAGDRTKELDCYLVFDADNFVIGCAYPEPTGDEKPRWVPESLPAAHARARLWAAAPDLLEACRKLLASLDAENGTYALSVLAAAREAARGAIEKAEAGDAR